MHYSLFDYRKKISGESSKTLASSMATPNDNPVPDRISAEDEAEITFPSPAKSGKGDVAADRRCFMYRHIRELASLYNGTRAVYNITVVIRNDKRGRSGTGFLGKFHYDDYPQNPTTVYGFFTANHVLGEELLLDEHQQQYEVTIRNRGLPLTVMSPDLNFRLIIKKSPVRFTCPLLDATFIEFGQDLLRALSEEKANLEFLDVCPSWMGAVGEEFRVLHYPHVIDDQHFSPGHMETEYGLHLFHSASTKSGSSGAPVMTIGGNGCSVVGIHTAQAKGASENYNVAVATKSVISAMKPALAASRGAPSHPGAYHVQVSHHPTRSEMKCLKTAIKAKNLKLDLRNRDEAVRIPSYFFHPGLEISGMAEKKTIYFVPTSHGWYWSAIAPDDPEAEPNWTSAETNVFGCGSGRYERKTVVEEREGFTFDKLRTVQLVDAQYTDNQPQLTKIMKSIVIS